MLRPKFLLNFAFGCFVGYTTALILAWILDSTTSEIFQKYAVYLFSAATTLLAATLALSSTLAAIENQNRLADEQRSRALAATKAFMPIALSYMCKVAKSGMLNCWNHQEMIGQTSLEDFERTSLERLTLSDDVISTFRDFIEHSRDHDGEKIALILNEYQVFFSRWRGRFSDDNYFSSENLREKCEHTTSWAYLYALSSAVFSHARGEEEEILRPDYTDDNVESALRLSGILYSNQARLSEAELDEAIGLYQRRFDRNFQ